MVAKQLRNHMLFISDDLLNFDIANLEGFSRDREISAGQSTSRRSRFRHHNGVLRSGELSRLSREGKTESTLHDLDSLYLRCHRSQWQPL